MTVTIYSKYVHTEWTFWLLCPRSSMQHDFLPGYFMNFIWKGETLTNRFT